MTVNDERRPSGAARQRGWSGEACGGDREGHVRAAFPDVKVILYRARRLPELRARDHVEDGFTIGRDLPDHGSEVTNSPSDTAVDGDCATRVKAICALSAEDKRQAY